eukprot:CAMPEP_0180000772 /NCGR_PEP_ID=MMETSP0984-20121128/10018_1 /TAXON_ID=483367 /ORGANISM="non described non described, Strain CCMP 2436" /LENGTH=62 /DNA_ID=CAMNT_0021920795 /DNA_START=96 /DNA_END=284 /DNA_ORIENTATION=-
MSTAAPTSRLGAKVLTRSPSRLSARVRRAARLRVGGQPVDAQDAVGGDAEMGFLKSIPCDFW